MRSLKDLVNERRSEEDIQRVYSKKVLPGEADWVNHKQLMENLTLDYVSVLKEKLSKNPKHVKTHQYSSKGGKKVDCIEIEFPELSQKFDTILSIAEVEGTVQQVRYIAFRSEPATACVRNIIGQ